MAGIGTRYPSGKKIPKRIQKEFKRQKKKVIAKEKKRKNPK